MPEAEEIQERWEVNTRFKKMPPGLFEIYKIFFPQIYTSSDILTTSLQAPSLGNYCTKHLEMTASTTYLHLVIRETTVRLNEDNEDI